MSIQAVKITPKARKWYLGSRIEFYEQIICTLFLIPFFPCEGLMAIGIDWSFFKWIGGAIIFIAALPTIQYLNKACIFYGLFYISIAFSTVLNHRDILPALSMAIQMVGLLILVHYYAHRGKLRCLIVSMKRFLGILILINLFIQIAYHDFFGLTVSQNTINLIASDNFQGYWYIPFILIVYLADMRKSKTYFLRNMCFWVAICLISLFFAEAATCLSIFVVFIFLLLIYRWKIMKFLTPWISLIASAVVSFLVIGLQIQKYFEWLIVDILHKDMTLSSRTYIWASTLANILKKPYFGYGTTSGGRLSINQIAMGFSKYTFFSHNVFLEILIQGGIVAMVFFVLIYIGASRSLKTDKESTDLKVMLSISVFSLLLMQFTEFAIYMPVANIPIILCYFYGELAREGFGRSNSGSSPRKAGRWHVRL